MFAQQAVRLDDEDKYQHGKTTASESWVEI